MTEPKPCYICDDFITATDQSIEVTKNKHAHQTCMQNPPIIYFKTKLDEQAHDLRQQIGELRTYLVEHDKKIKNVDSQPADKEIHELRDWLYNSLFNRFKNSIVALNKEVREIRQQMADTEKLNHAFETLETRITQLEKSQEKPDETRSKLITEKTNIALHETESGDFRGKGEDETHIIEFAIGKDSREFTPWYGIATIRLKEKDNKEVGHISVFDFATKEDALNHLDRLVYEY